MRTFLLFIVLLFICSSSFSQTAEEYLKMADDKMEKEDYKYALTLVEKAISLNDTNQWPYLRKADILFKLYGPREAIESIYKIIPLNAKNPEPYNRLGDFYASGGMADSAIIMYNMAIRYSANNDTAKYAYIANRGTAKASIRDFEGAIKDYQKVLEFNPRDIAALNNISAAYDEMGMKNDGIEALKSITKIDPTFIGAFINLGFIYSKLDSLDLAISYFNKALAIDPKEPLVYSNRGNTYYKKGDYDKALKDLNYSVSLYPTNSYVYRNLGLVYIAMKDYKEACTSLHYAAYYNFAQQFGPEVDDLINKYCK